MSYSVSVSSIVLLTIPHIYTFQTKCVKSPNVNCGSFNKQSDLSHPDQVGMIFGPHILQYSQNLCQGRYDYIVRLPNALLFNIMEHLDLEDISVVSRTCRRFKEVRPLLFK